MKHDWIEFGIVLFAIVFVFWLGWLAKGKSRDIDNILKQDRKERP